MSWVASRVLTKAQVSGLKERLDGWISKVNAISNTLEQVRGRVRSQGSATRLHCVQVSTGSYCVQGQVSTGKWACLLRGHMYRPVQAVWEASKRRGVMIGVCMLALTLLLVILLARCCVQESIGVALEVV